MPSDMWSIYVGSKDGVPVSALLLFYFNGTVEYFTPVIKSEHRNTQALALVIFQAMKDAVKNRGCKNWNWGGTWLSQTGVYDFKKRWGTTDYPYYYYTKLFNEEVKSSSKDTMQRLPGFFVLPFSELEKIEMNENKQKLIIVGTGPQAQIARDFFKIFKSRRWFCLP